MNKIVPKYITYPFVNFIKSVHPNYYLKKLNKSQWLSYNDIKKLQDEKLRKLIRHAYDNVPYYHKLFKQINISPNDIKTHADLTKLPILTRSIIKENYMDMFAINIPRTNLKMGRTSGTSGTPLVYYHDRNCINITEALDIRSYGWAGYEIGDRIATIWGNPILNLKNKEYSKMIIRRLKNIQYIPLPNVNEKIAQNVICKLKNFNPEVIRGYSKSIYLLARIASDKSLQDIRPRSIITTAETLYEDQAKLIERKFNTKIFREYGSGEIRSIAMECNAHIGYHINAEHVILEVLHEKDDLGSFIITDLDNFGMPFIRYRNGDLGIKSEESCSCGRGLPLIKYIEGRVHDILRTPDGKWVAPSCIDHFMGSPGGIIKYQIIQESLKNLMIKIVPGDSFSMHDQNNIINEMKSLFGNEIEINIDVVNEIPVSISGKNKYIISNIEFDDLK